MTRPHIPFVRTPLVLAVSLALLAATPFVQSFADPSQMPHPADAISQPGQAAVPIPPPQTNLPAAGVASTPAPAAPPPLRATPNNAPGVHLTPKPAGAGGTPATRAAGPTPTIAGANTTAPVPTLKPGEVLLNFQAADIQAVVKAVSQMTNRNFLIDPRVKGQITILSAKPMSAGAAYQVFLSALKMQGFTAVDGPGDAIRLIPTGEAKLSADVSAHATPRGGEQITTHILAVQHVPATQLVPILRPLMSPTSQLSSYDAANLLILTDYADNVRRMIKIVEKLDQASTSDISVIELKHTSALDMADLIGRLVSGGGTTPGVPSPAQPGGQVGVGGDRASIVPDLRTNSLLVRTENPGRLEHIRSLVEKLDVPAKATGNTRVVYLKNAEATKIAEVLRGLLAAEARAAGGATASTASAGGAVAARATATARTSEPSLIQADEATNALIISASDAVYNNLRGVIEQLDVRRAQVFVEALIVEISADRTNELGFQWMGGREHGTGLVGAMTNFPAATPGIAAVAADPRVLATAGGLSVAFLGDKITLADGTQVRGLGGLARALESKSLGNILSTPNLMTLDNAEAKIIVGQNVPFLTGSFAATGTGGGTTGGVNPFQTIERKDVGITLKIKPQISEGGVVKLDIYQEVSSVARSATGIATDLITNKRSVESKVVVDDGHTIALGGLIEDTVQESTQAVPLLGSIPLLGALFRYKQNVTRKTNLMVFLRPTIIRSPQDGFQVTVDRYNYLRAKSKEADDERGAVVDRLAPTPPPPKPAPTTKEKAAREIPGADTKATVPEATEAAPELLSPKEPAETPAPPGD